MNKSELIAAIAEHANLTKADAGRAFDGLIKTIEATLKAGDSVALIGFGTFDVKERAERVGRNPQTGEVITIAASKVPSFKAGKSLKDAVTV
jgi:DNA-binding protein HU-beta